LSWYNLEIKLKALLAESVKKRIRFRKTTYRKSHDQQGRSWIEIDGHTVLSMNPKLMGMDEDWENHFYNYWDLPTIMVDYIHMSISDILDSDHPIFRAIGMLDRRLGKRRLLTIEDIEYEDILVRKFYYLRCDSEGWNIHMPEDEHPLTDSIYVRIPRRRVAINENFLKKKLAGKKQETDLIKNINYIFNGNPYAKEDYARDHYKSPVLQSIFDMAATIPPKDKNLLLEYVNVLAQKTTLLSEEKYTNSALLLFKSKNQWFRDFRNWRVMTTKIERQFISLSHYLFAKYSVPLFMDDAWHQNNELYQKWFLHLANGGNIRTAEGFPVPYTKKMSHFFFKAPAKSSINSAIRFGQIRALGGGKKLAESINHTRLEDDFEHDHFGQTVISFFIKYPSIKKEDIAPIIDYIWDQKFQDYVTHEENGDIVNHGPLKPNFSMNGRTPKRLLENVEKWHDELNKRQEEGDLEWGKSDIENFVKTSDLHPIYGRGDWVIKQLLSSNDLYYEGALLKHCILSYAISCFAGTTAIWSFSFKNIQNDIKLLTIEMNIKRREICQVRGMANRFPNQNEMKIIKQWAQRENVTVPETLPVR
jgi:hypothetical protein